MLRLGGDSRPGSAHVARRLQETDGAGSLLSSSIYGATTETAPDAAADVVNVTAAGYQPAGPESGGTLGFPGDQVQQASSPSAAVQHQSAQPRLLAEILPQEPSSGVSARDVSLQPVDPAETSADFEAAPLPASPARLQPDGSRPSLRRGHWKKRSAPVVTLAAGAEADAWWTRIATDTAKCGVRDAGKARLLASARQESGDACEAACRCAAPAQLQPSISCRNAKAK